MKMKTKYKEIVKKEVKRIAYFILIGIFILSFLQFVSANDKIYNPIKKEITFSNSTGTIATAVLNTPLQNPVPLGDNVKIFELTIDANSNYLNFLNNFQLIDQKTGLITDRVITLKQKQINIVSLDIDDYARVCIKGKDQNITTGLTDDICNIQKVGSHKENREEISYIPIGKDLSKGKITIAGFTKVNKGDYIEWIPTLFNQKVTEWATYYQSDFTAYWKFNEASGTAYDSGPNGYNASNPGSMSYTTGKLGNAIYFVGTKALIVGEKLNLSINPYTIGFWYNTTSGATYNFVLGKGNGNSYWDYAFFLQSGTLRFREDYGGTDICVDTATSNDGNWHQVVLIRNSTHTAMYRDNVRVCNVVDATNWTNNFNFWIGSTDGIHNFTGMIDNLFVRLGYAFNVSDIQENWNSGIGLEYGPVISDNVYPTFSNIIFSPGNNSAYMPGQTYQINVNVNNTNITSVGMEFNGVNQTFFQSPVNNYTFIGSLSNLSSGNYKYYFYALGNGTAKNFNRTLDAYYVVTQSTGSILLYLNNARNNITITNGTLFWINATLINGTGSINIYNNHTLINTGNSPLNNFTSFNVSGIYLIRANYTGNNNFSSANEFFYVNVINATTTTTQANGIFSLDFTTTRGVTIFIVMLIISILTLIYVQWYLGCVFIFVVGFIALINYAGLFLGVMIILVSIVLMFMKNDK